MISLRIATALALLAFAGVKPNAPLAQQAANLLLRDRACLYGKSPQALGSAVVALAAFQSTIQAAEADFEVKVLVNGEQVAVVKSGDMGRRTTVPVPAKLIKAGDNTVRFENGESGSWCGNTRRSGSCSIWPKTRRSRTIWRVAVLTR